MFFLVDVNVVGDNFVVLVAVVATPLSPLESKAVIAACVMETTVLPPPPLVLALALVTLLILLMVLPPPPSTPLKFINDGSA